MMENLMDAQWGKGYFNLYFMLLLDHISCFHSFFLLSVAPQLQFVIIVVISTSKTFSLLLIQQLMLMLPLLLLGNVGKIMKPFTQLSEKTTKSSCLMLSTTKSLLMMSHYPFLSLSLSVSSRSAATNIGIAVFNKALNEIRRGKVFFSLFCKTLPSYHH